MIAFVFGCFVAGIFIAIPVWILSQHYGARRGLDTVRGFDPEAAVPCVIEPVVLKGRWMPDLDCIEEADDEDEPEHEREDGKRSEGGER